MFLLLRSERGGDLGSLRVKKKNLLNGANGEKKYGKRKRSKDEWETKQAGDSVKALLVRMALYMLVKLLEVN